MDRSWDPADCRPTVNDYNLPPEEVRQARDEIRWHTDGIASTPYNPEIWLMRSTQLLDIGYPELAVGDGYKATLLVDDGLDYSSALGELVRLHFGMSLFCHDHKLLEDEHSSQLLIRQRLLEFQHSAFIVMVKSLTFLEAHADCVGLCMFALSKFPLDTFYVEGQMAATKRLIAKRNAISGITMLTKKQKEYELRHGFVLMRPYPWIPAEYMQRSQALVDAINEELKTYGPKCKIQPSSLKTVPPPKIGSVQTAPDNLGVFATKPIEWGGRVFLDVTPVSATFTNILHVCGNCCGSLPPTPMTLQCCKTAVFCSSRCRELALTHYHSPLCGKDFSWLYADAQNPLTDTPDMRPAMFLRLLAMCVQQGAAHPLQLPSMARLMPSYNSHHPCGWTMRGNIMMPIMILQAFGIDVFADPRYDTWVLQTMWWRTKNNASGEVDSAVPIYAINPFYSFVNHSCEPNVYWGYQNSSTIELKALRRIKKGEELYTSYLTSGDMPKAERSKWLNQWLGGDCACSKCLGEP